MYHILEKIRHTKSSIKARVNSKISQKSQKIIKNAILIFLVIAFIPEIYLIPYYFVVVKPSAETEIQEILNRVQMMNSTQEKVTSISDWQEQNFTNIYGIEPNTSLDFGWYPIFKTGRYPVYYNPSNHQKIKIRALLSPFTGDPFWITYFHSGACGELASLFNYVANKSAIESRIVQTKGEDHGWVEIKIKNAWYYFDPTLVEIYQRNPDQRDKWFSTPNNFEDAWGWNISRVTIISTEEDLTSNYTRTVNVSVMLNSTKQITLYKFDNGKNSWFTLFTKSPSESKNQTIETLQLGDSNRYKIRASNYGSTFYPIPMYQEQEFFLNSTDNVSIFINPDDGQIDFVLLGIISTICFIVVGYEIKWIREWLRKRKEK